MACGLSAVGLAAWTAHIADDELWEGRARGTYIPGHVEPQIH